MTLTVLDRRQNATEIETDAQIGGTFIAVSITRVIACTILYAQECV